MSDKAPAETHAEAMERLCEKYVLLVVKEFGADPFTVTDLRAAYMAGWLARGELAIADIREFAQQIDAWLKERS